MRLNSFILLHYFILNERFARWHRRSACDVDETEPHSPTLTSLHLRHSSFSTLPFHLRHSSFYNPSFASPTSQALHLRHLASRPWCKIRMRYDRPSKWHAWAELILQPFHHFTYVTAHSPTLPSLYLRHSSFSYPTVASPTSQLIFQTLLSHLLRHRLFTYLTWRADHDVKNGWDTRDPVSDIYKQSSFS